MIVALALLKNFILPDFVLCQQRVTRLDSLFKARQKEGLFNGNVLVADQGRIVYRQAFGYANLEKAFPNRVQSRSDLGSTSKLFTAVAVLQLKEKGLIKLQDAVVKYIPDFPYPSITVWHLLTHTSGLPDFEIFDSYYAKDPHQILANKELVPAIKQYGQVLSKPGEQWNYSSPGMGLLASIIEKVSDLPFEKYLAKHIWAPSGMHHTYINSLIAPVSDTARVENYAKGIYYSTDLSKADTMGKHIQFSQVAGALVGPGLVVSDTRDLFLFDQALYAGRLLKTATMEEAFTPIKLNNGEYARPYPWLGETLFGLGWFIIRGNSSGTMVLHTGKHAGIVTVFLRNISKRQTLVLFDNTESDGLNNTAINALNILNDKPFVIFKKSLARLYAQDLLQYSPDFAMSHFNTLKSDTANYHLNVQEMDYVGHQLLDHDHKIQGLETLKLLTLLDSKSYYPYYSYGIALQQNGKREEAIMSLKQALAIKADYKEAATALRQILKE